MAHAKTELQLANGLTVLVGPNNIGKSTVAVALKILARNTNSNFVMQHEQKECSIFVETSEGHTIQWTKRKSPGYVINGQAKDRLGRGGTPPELDETLRLAPVEFEDKDFEPHFGEQKSPIFLINRPPSQIAQFFSTTSDAEKLVAMQRLHQRHRTDAQTQTKLLSAKNESIQQSLDTLESIPELDSEFASLEREAQSLTSLANEIANLEGLIRTYAHLSLEQQFEMHRSNCLQRLLPLPALHPTEHLEVVASEWEISAENHRCFEERTRLLCQLAATPKLQDAFPLTCITRDLGLAVARMEYCHEHFLAIAELIAPTNFTPTDGLQSLVEGIQHLEIESQKTAEIKQAATNLTAPPSMVPEDAIGGMIRQFDQTSLDQTRLDSLRTILMPLPVAPPVTDSTSLTEAIVSFAITNEQYEKNQLLLDLVQHSITVLESDAQQWLRTEPTCGTCGGKLSVDSIRFKMNRHGG